MVLSGVPAPKSRHLAPGTNCGVDFRLAEARTSLADLMHLNANLRTVYDALVYLHSARQRTGGGRGGCQMVYYYYVILQLELLSHITIATRVYAKPSVAYLCRPRSLNIQRRETVLNLCSVYSPSKEPTSSLKYLTGYPTVRKLLWTFVPNK